MNQLLSFLVSRAGGIITPIIAAAVAWSVSQLAALSPELASTVDQAAVTGFIFGLIMSVVNAYTNRAQTQGVEAIQQAARTVQFSEPSISLGQRAVKVDGIPGPITTKVVTDLLAKLLK
jgi:fructose-specific phosphotransferase system IIC component